MVEYQQLWFHSYKLLRDYNFFLNGIHFILWRNPNHWFQINGLDFMNMIYCVPWSKSIKGIMCSSFFLHHCWAEGACTYHFTIRLLICNAILFFFPFLVVFELCAAYEHSRPVCIKTFSNWDTFIWKKALYPGWIWKKSDQSRCPLMSCKLATNKMEKFIMHCYRMQKPCVQARYVREWNW